MPNSPQSPFSDSSIAKAVSEVENKNLSNEIDLGIEADQTKGIGAEIVGEKNLTDSVSVAADASWWQRAGWSVAGFLRWRK